MPDLGPVLGPDLGPVLVPDLVPDLVPKLPLTFQRDFTVAGQIFTEKFFSFPHTFMNN